MLDKLKEAMNDKDYPIWLFIGLVLLIISQFLGKLSGTLAQVLSWVLFAVVVIIYGAVLYLNDRERRARKKAQEEKEGEKGKEGRKEEGD